MATSDLIRFRLNQAIDDHRKGIEMEGGKWTLKGFAGKYDISYEHLRQIVSGRSNVSEKTARILGQKIGGDPNLLLKPIDESEIPSDLAPVIQEAMDLDSDKVQALVDFVKVLKNLD